MAGEPLLPGTDVVSTPAENYVYAAVHFYQVFSFFCFAGFITFLVLYLNLEDTTGRELNPVITSNCNFIPVSRPVVRQGFNNPYSMVLDHTTGNAMLATFTTVLITLEAGDVSFLHHNFLYTLRDDGEVQVGWEGITQEVAMGVPFNENREATVQQTVVSESLTLLTNGTYLWDLKNNAEFMNDLFKPPVVPGNSGNQSMVVGSVQEWQQGVIIHYVTEDGANSPAGAQSRLGAFTYKGGGGVSGTPQVWERQYLNPLSAVTAGLGRFGFNRFNVADESIMWGTNDPFLMDYDSPSLTWKLAPINSLLPDVRDSRAYAMTRSGLELFVVSNQNQLLQYARLSHTPADDASNPQIREFILQNRYPLLIDPNSPAVEIRVNESSVVLVDNGENAFYYRRAGFAQFCSLDQTLSLSSLLSGATQTNLMDMTQVRSTVKKTQYLAIPVCVPETCPTYQLGETILYHDACP